MKHNIAIERHYNGKFISRQLNWNADSTLEPSVCPPDYSSMYSSTYMMIVSLYRKKYLFGGGRANSSQSGGGGGGDFSCHKPQNKYSTKTKQGTVLLIKMSIANCFIRVLCDSDGAAVGPSYHKYCSRGCCCGRRRRRLGRRIDTSTFIFFYFLYERMCFCFI